MSHQSIMQLVDQLLLFLDTLGKGTVSDYAAFKLKLEDIRNALATSNISTEAFGEAESYEDLVQILFQKRINLEDARKRGEDLFGRNKSK